MITQFVSVSSKKGEHNPWQTVIQEIVEATIPWRNSCRLRVRLGGYRRARNETSKLSAKSASDNGKGDMIIMEIWKGLLWTT